MATCIWCKKKVLELAVEHIIPEPLGCPKGFTLSGGEICLCCNNKLAHLDMAVIEELEIPTFMANVKRKRNRPAIINTRGNVIGKNTEDGKTIIINMENYPIKHSDGTIVGAYGKSDRNVKASFRKEDKITLVSFQTTIGRNPKFVRGIYKIAFESIVYFLGLKYFLDDKYDNIRNFVIHGDPQRKIIYFACPDNEYRNEVKAPSRKAEDQYGIEFRLGFVAFVVDLSPNLTLFPEFLHKAKELWGERGWGYLPL